MLSLSCSPSQIVPAITETNTGEQHRMLERAGGPSAGYELWAPARCRVANRDCPMQESRGAALGIILSR